MKALHLLLGLIFSVSVSLASDPLSSWGEYPRPVGASAPVSISFGNGLFVAVGANGTIITSSDGINWAAQNSGGTDNLFRVNFVNNRFFVFGASALVSTNGTNWTAVPDSAGYTGGMRSITFDGNAYFASSRSDIIRFLMTSTNLVDWTSYNITLPQYSSPNPDSILFANGKYLLSAGPTMPTMHHSSDAHSWTAASYFTGGAREQGELTFQNGVFIQTCQFMRFVGNSFETLGAIRHSVDGVAWNNGLTIRAVSQPILPAKIATGGGYFVYPAGASIYYTNSMGTFGQSLYVEPDWSRIDLTLSSAAEGSKSDVAFGNNVFVAVTLGKIFKSNPLEGSAPIQITKQPASLSVTTGGTAKFTVLAQGSDPISYQWRHAGTNLVGQTASILQLTDITLDMAGSYDVEITNPSGTVTSAAAALSVQFAEVLRYSGITLRGNVGDRFLLEFQNDLDPNAGWSNLTTITLSAPQYIYIDYDSPSQTNRFYRATFQAP